MVKSQIRWTGLVLFFVLDLFLYPSNSLADITTGLSSYWKLSDGITATTPTTVVNSSGTLNGILVNGAMWINDKDNLPFKAVQFDGIDDRINAGYASSLDITGNQITISAWIKPSSFGENSRGRIVDKSDGNVYGYLFTLDGANTTNGLGFGINSGSLATNEYAYVANAINLNQWQHVVVVYDGTVKFYVNGVQKVTTQGLAGSILSSSNTPMSIGGRPLLGRNYAGGIDEVRIYNRALTASEVSQIYLLGTSGVVADTPPPVRSNGLPTGTLTSGTTSTTLSVTTNENSVCKYSTTANLSYASMSSVFTTTGSTSHSTTASGLSNGNSYNYYVRCQDTAGNANTNDYLISFSVAPAISLDTTAPNAVSNLMIYNPETTSMMLQWTAPGDDGAVGTATSYDVRYSTLPITSVNWSRATTVIGEPVPLVVGTAQTMKVSGLSKNTPYYFAIKTTDDAGNVSLLSNVAKFQTYPDTYYGGYTSLGKLYEEMESLAISYPNIVELVDFGDSYAKTQGVLTDRGGNPVVGYDLRALKITNKSTLGVKPPFMIVGNMHGREITVSEIEKRFINRLVTLYGIDADITSLIDNEVIWIVPVLNPDGRWMTERAMYAPYSYASPWLWRKNVSDIGNPACTWPPTNLNQPGTDLNRNFSWPSWSRGSTDPCNAAYRGVAVDSEVETKAIETLFKSIFSDYRGPLLTDPASLSTVGLTIDFHNPSTIIGYSWEDMVTPAPNASALSLIVTKMALRLGAPYAYGQVFNALYEVDAGMDDWLYGNLGIPTILYELNGDFQPAYSTVDSFLVPQGHYDNFIYGAKIARQPYVLVLGPEASSLSFSGTTLIASVNDTRNGNQNISTAEYYIDTPPWKGGTGVPMTATDGIFNSTIESVRAAVSTSGLSIGRHIIFVRGKDVGNNWGPVSAVFLNVN